MLNPHDTGETNFAMLQTLSDDVITYAANEPRRDTPDYPDVRETSNLRILGTCFRFWFFSGHWTMHLNSLAKELRYRWSQTAAKVGHLVAPGKLWFNEVWPDQIYVLQNTGKPWTTLFHRLFGGEDFVLGVSRTLFFSGYHDIGYMFQIDPHSSACQFGCAPCMRVFWQVDLFSVRTPQITFSLQGPWPCMMHSEVHQLRSCLGRPGTDRMIRRVISGTTPSGILQLVAVEVFIFWIFCFSWGSRKCKLEVKYCAIGNLDEHVWSKTIANIGIGG